MAMNISLGLSKLPSGKTALTPYPSSEITPPFSSTTCFLMQCFVRPIECSCCFMSESQLSSRSKLAGPEITPESRFGRVDDCVEDRVVDCVVDCMLDCVVDCVVVSLGDSPVFSGKFNSGKTDFISNFLSKTAGSEISAIFPILGSKLA